jgi:CRP-like cAMP-binding protein
MTLQEKINFKNELVDRYILPFFAEEMENKEELRQDLHRQCKLQEVAKMELLEVPGPADEGRMWFSVSSTVHSYCVCEKTAQQRGRQIWKKLELILDSESLMEGSRRMDYIEALEPGLFLSIGFPELRTLMRGFPEVQRKTGQLARQQQHYYSRHSKLLTEPAAERVIQLRREHPVFIACSTQEIHATHINMSLRTYVRYLRKKVEV